jgi:RNA polymerase sigma-70 factor (ECF subfamily)
VAVAEHRERIYRYLLSMTRDASTADDLTQETMLRAMRNLGSLREPGALPRWLYRLATNIFLDRARATQRLTHRVSMADPTMETGGAAAPEVGPDRVAEVREMSACVQGYLNQLPDPYHAAVLLHDGYGLTDREVAETLGISLANAKTRIHRARARLRDLLGSGCQFETDNRGVLVCQPAPDEAGCPSDCACHGASEPTPS